MSSIAHPLPHKTENSERLRIIEPIIMLSLPPVETMSPTQPITSMESTPPSVHLVKTTSLPHSTLCKLKVFIERNDVAK